jgi:hypothetical protein
VVGLNRTASNQGVGPLGQGISDKELKFTGLIAAGRQTEEIVSFDVNVGPP